MYKYKNDNRCVYFSKHKTLSFDIRLIAFQTGELKKINSIVTKQHANENIERFENETKFSKQGDNQHCSDKLISKQDYSLMQMKESFYDDNFVYLTNYIHKFSSNMQVKSYFDRVMLINYLIPMKCKCEL